MRADERSGLEGIPDFGAVASRHRLASLVDSHATGLTLLVAPSGYGKSVLAAQYMMSKLSGQGLWLDCSRAAQGLDSVLHELLVALSPAGDRRERWAPGVRALRDDSEDLILSVATAVSRLDDPRATVVVLDDLADVGAESIQQLATLGRRLRGLGARLIVTTRSVGAGAAVWLHDAQVVDAEDLKLTQQEAAGVASAVLGEDVAERAVASLLHTCMGHPATFVVLLRHAALGPEGWTPKETPSLDLRSQLMYVASSQLSSSEQEALHVMALLGRGTVPDLRRCGLECNAHSILQICAVVPLVRVAEARSVAITDQFRVHDLAQEVFSSEEYTATLSGLADSVWSLAVDVLMDRGETLRAALTVESRAEESQTADWLLRYGDQVLRHGGSSCLMRMIEQLPVNRFITSPGLLLVHARLLREYARFGEAIEKASVARTIAEHEKDEVLIADSLLVAGECHSEIGNYEAALGLLSELAARSPTWLTHDQRAWAHAVMAGCCMHLGRDAEAVHYACTAESLACDCASAASVQSYVMGTAGAISTLIRGDIAASLSHFNRAAETGEVPKALQAKALGNRAVCLCEMGRLDRCVEAVGASLNTCLEADRGLYGGTFLPVRGAAMLAQGSSEAGLSLMRDGIALSLEVGDRQGAAYNRIYHATALRAIGRAQESLSEAEQALESFSGLDASSQRELATLELAASLLTLDDVAAAARAVESVRSTMSGLNLYHLVRADMIIAEIERREGHVDRAVARLMGHEKYILTESSNWQIAMYCRAFPEMLGLFVRALGTERLPAHLLRMIPPENAEIVLEATRELLEPKQWTRLAQRLLGKEGLAEYVARGGRPLCRVKLFGGLEVNVGGRVVTEREWRKRKARLLFAMLVIRGGQDVPRDQVLDYLWPDMDEARAKNNLYVIWSAMKSALSPEAGKNEPCPFISNTGAVCRVVADSVRSDVEEFDHVLAQAREALNGGNPADALRPYERLAEIYRGELLPGDVYDDWFAQVRDEYRATYADAMLQAASILRSRDDHLGALTFVRRALNQDPWREDLYQAALACQIGAGQRSAAIDTYLQCRARLSEDLGLEPSAETRALYDEILAMEERPAPRSTWPES